jgi:hypothetical protein
MFCFAVPIAAETLIQRATFIAPPVNIAPPVSLLAVAILRRRLNLVTQNYHKEVMRIKERIHTVPM